MTESKYSLMALPPVAFTLIAALGLAGCGSPPQVIAEEHGKAQPLVELATADLQERLAVSSDEIALQSVKATDFPDASLGVPEPGKMYAQVITPGYVIRLVVNGAV